MHSLEEFMFGPAPHPVDCGHGVLVGGGIVAPELNFTLPPLHISDARGPTSANSIAR